MTIKTFFHETWQSVSGCMELIVRSVAKESAQDKLFKCDISLSNMSEKPLYSYLARKKQVNNVWVILLGVLLMQDIWWYFLLYFCHKKFCY